MRRLARRDAANIWRLVDGGASEADVADLYGITEYDVRGILGLLRRRADPPIAIAHMTVFAAVDGERIPTPIVFGVIRGGSTITPKKRRAA